MATAVLGSLLNKPTPFGKYYLLERINVGGMAEVFKAKTVGVEGFERLLAVKRILPNIAEDEEFITMFIDEAKIAVQLQHANIAQIFDLGKVDDSYFIALEYVHGRDLRSAFDELRRRGETMPMAQACYVVMQVCEGLDYAHNKRDSQGRPLNLVHRDVSPQNVLIGYEGEVKLIDFGIAKAAGKASKTQAGILKGKFGYMSPEQVRGLPIDRRSDIFALGIILYEMLTSERLFVGESDFSTLEKVRNVEIVPPSSINSAISEQLERIILKALAKDVEDRYQNAIDLHDDLQAFLYSAGQFSSRKDLSAWMKRTFSAGEQQEETPALEEVEEIEEIEPVSESPEPEVKTASAVPAAGDESLSWDEEELETSIFDKPHTLLNKLGNESFSGGTEDKTVAGVPSEAVLAGMTAQNDDAAEDLRARTPLETPVVSMPPTGRQTGPILRQTVLGLGQPTPIVEALPNPGLVTPPPSGTPWQAPSPVAPILPTRTQSQPIPTLPQTWHTPVPGVALDLPRPPTFEAPRPAFRQTLLGAQSAPVPVPMGQGLSMPSPRPIFPGQAVGGFDSPAGGFGTPTGSAFTPMGLSMGNPAMVGTPLSGDVPVSVRAPSRFKYYVLFVIFMALGGVSGYLYLTRPGKLQIAVKPQDARVTVDGIPQTGGPPYVFERKPGQYSVAAVRDGYATKEQTVEIRAGRVEHIDVELEASADTGFELTSQPPGGLVWLDGQPFTVDDSGKQATTNFRATRVAPGRHVLEIRGDPRYKDWRREIFQEASQTLKIHAEREMAGATTGGSPAGATAAPPATGTAAKQPAAGGGRRASSGRSGRSPATGDDVGGLIAASVTKPVESGKRTESKRSSAGSDVDIFETEGKLGSGSAAAAGGSKDCIVTIGSKPWAEVAIDGRSTGKNTPLVDYPVACGKHRITFSNPELMIERNEIIQVKPGQKFKKVFPLVDTDF